MAPIEKILFHETTGVLSLVSGGGKSSIMFHLARQLAVVRKKVLTTNTIKIFVPTIKQSSTLLVNPDPEVILTQTANRRKGYLR